MPSPRTTGPQPDRSPGSGLASPTRRGIRRRADGCPMALVYFCTRTCWPLRIIGGLAGSIGLALEDHDRKLGIIAEMGILEWL